MTEYIAWHEGRENLERMKTRVNKIPRNQAPCPWSRFGRSSKKEKWRYNVLHDIIQHFNSELKQRRFELEACRPKVRCLHPPAWAVFYRALWCPNFRGKRSIKTISNRNLGFMTFLKKTKVSLPINVRRTSLLELSIKRRNKRQCCAKLKLKRKTEKVYGTMSEC